jgi:RES domain-containing protein
LSLAALEHFVHLDIDIAPPGLIAIPAHVPDDLKLETIDATSLPKNWRTHPGPEALKDTATDWLGRSATAVLAVPSAVIPSERNYLINPKHPDFSRVRIENPIPFEFDPRMWK